MNQYRETKKEDWTKTIINVLIFSAVIIIGAILLLPVYWPVWFIVVIGGLFLLVRWHTKNFAYRCSECGHEFEISAFTNFISLQTLGKGGGWKYLKCPKCQKRAKAAVLKKIKK